VSGLDDGGTVLLHDSDCTSTPRSWQSTAAVLPLLAAELSRRGLVARPLREHLVRRG
jgi:peptidoglycan-N-acetylglucosamine deacetylase